MAREDKKWTDEEIADAKARDPNAKPARINMIYRKSTPRIVNVRMTEKGAQDETFKRFMFSRFGSERSDDWMTKRFQEVK